VYAGTGFKDGDSFPGSSRYESIAMIRNDPQPAAVTGPIRSGHSPYTGSMARPTGTDGSTRHSVVPGLCIGHDGLGLGSGKFYPEVDQNSDTRFQQTTRM